MRLRAVGSVLRVLPLLVGAATAEAQSASDSLLDRAARAVAQARTMRANFEQSLTNPDLKETKTSRGEFAQHGAARFAMRFTDPPGDAIIADGNAVWLYLPSASRGQALKLPLTQGSQLDLISQLLTSPRTSYKISDGGSATVGGRSVHVVHLQPKVQGTPFSRATLWLDKEDALVRQLEAVELSGLIRRIRFSDIKTDIDLPANHFSFTPPAGVKVIDAGALMGGVRPPPPR